MPTPSTRTGYADLPLHGGKAPRWLFERMVKLSRVIALAVVEEEGTQGLLRRLSDPHWFQALGCALGFDWHSSGLTTTACGALKEGWREVARETGLYFAGGKGATSRKTPGEIAQVGEQLGKDLSSLVYASRMAAKVDSAAVQDGYQIYHHTFVFTVAGEWAVLQQGMNERKGYARRYHWLGAQVESFVEEPHAAICGEREGQVLNLVAHESDKARATIATVAAEEKPKAIINDLTRLQGLTLPAHHHVALQDIHPDRLERTFLSIYEHRPPDFEALLALAGVGPKTVRALSLVAELVYGAPANWRDPVSYSFAHGGKDGHPYPVDRSTYDQTIALFSRALHRAKVGQREEMEALRRLQAWYGEPTALWRGDS